MITEKNNTIGPMRTEDATATAVIFHYWNKWVDEMEGSKRIPSAAEKAFLAMYQVSGASPIALMFIAFEAGMDCGMELEAKMNSLAQQRDAV